MKASKNSKEQVLKAYSADYKLWVTFTFNLRSTAELKALGFTNVPTRVAAQPPSIEDVSEWRGPTIPKYINTDKEDLVALPAVGLLKVSGGINASGVGTISPKSIYTPLEKRSKGISGETDLKKPGRPKRSTKSLSETQRSRSSVHSTADESTAQEEVIESNVISKMSSADQVCTRLTPEPDPVLMNIDISKSPLTASH